MKKCLHISSTTPATLHLATGDSFYVGDKKVHLLTQNNLFATYEPKNNKYLTYSFNLPAESNNVVKVVPYYNGHYDITLSPTLVSTWSATNQVYSKTYGKITQSKTANIKLK